MPWDTPLHTVLSGNVAGTTRQFGSALTLEGGSNVTVSGVGNGHVLLVGGGGGPQTQFVLSNSNGLGWGTNGSTVTGSYTVPNVPAQTAYVFSNSNGVGFGTNGSTVTASYTVPAAQTQFVLSASNGLAWGTNASTVTGSYTQFSLANSNGVTFGTNVVNGAVTGSVQTNYAGTGTAATNASVTLNTAGISISVAAPGAGVATNASYWENPIIDGMTSWSGTSNSISVQRIFVPMNMTATRAEFLMNISGSLSGAGSMRFNLGLYTMNHSTLSTVSTTSRGLTFQSTSAISYTAVSGPRSWSIPLGAGWNIVPGEYFLAFNYGMTTASTNTVFARFYGGGIGGSAAGWETGALANVTDVFRSGAINNVAASVLADTMQANGMTYTGASAPLQPWVGFYGSF